MSYHDACYASAGPSSMESGSESSNSQEFDLEYEAEGCIDENDEYKYLDTANSFSVDTTGEVPATGQLCLIPQGNTASTRIGRSCVVRSIHIKWNLVYSPGASTSGVTSIGIYLILDKQCNGAAAAVTDVFTGDELTQEHQNLENVRRFVILKRWHLLFRARAGVAGDFSDDIKNIDWCSRLSVPLEFSGTTGAIGTIRSNNIFIMASAFASDDLVAVTGVTRIRYSDM